MFMKQNEATAASLFSGAGGMDLGFEQAGFNIIFANELDKTAASSWIANRPDDKSDIMHIGDIHSVFEHLPKSVDVVFGGPPCQGFSITGKMNPNDKRSNLVFSYLTAVDKMRPKCFVMENVEALGKISKWKTTRETIISQAESIGYNCAFEIIDARDFGISQKRRRTIFVGIRDDIDSTPKDVFESIHRHESKHLPAKEVLSMAGLYGSGDNPAYRFSPIVLLKKPVMRKSPYAGMLVNGRGRPVDLDDAFQTICAFGGNSVPIIDENSLRTGSENWFVGYHRKLMDGSTFPEIETPPDYLRRATLKELAIIQGFPKTYIFNGSMAQRFKQIGNAVAVGVASAIAEGIKDSLTAI